MKIARIKHQGREVFARVDEKFHILHADSLLAAVSAKETGEVVSEAKLLAPVVPSKVLAMGCAFLPEGRTFDPQVDREPFFFLKPSSAVIGRGEAIEVPEPARGAIFESELAVVIGTDCKAVSEEDALDYVLGYTICNDMSAPALMGKDGQWSRGKGLDTFCPLGPWIETDVGNPDDLRIKAGLQREGQFMDLVDSSTKEQIWTAARSISYCSEYVTLKAGDVISLGCPPGPIPVQDGDEVAVTIENIGNLSNPVRYV